MNRLVEIISNFSLAQSYWEDMGNFLFFFFGHMGNFLLSISSKHGVNAGTASQQRPMSSSAVFVF